MVEKEGELKNYDGGERQEKHDRGGMVEDGRQQSRGCVGGKEGRRQKLCL